MFRRMTRERYLSDAELSDLMRVVRERKHVHQPRDHAFFGLIANVGIRPSEAMRLCVRDVHATARRPWILVRRQHPPHAPRPVERLVMHRDVATVVQRYVASLPREDAGCKLFPFTKRQSARLFHYYADKAGLSPRRKIYALRHTAGMRMMRYTGDLRLVQAIMGHVRLKASMAYLQSDHAAMVAAQSQLETI